MFERVYQLPGQQKLYFRRHPRYGTWSVGFDKGGIPASLSGQFLQFRELYDKVEYYLANRQKNPVTIGEEITDG